MVYFNCGEENHRKRGKEDTEMFPGMIGLLIALPAVLMVGAALIAVLPGIAVLLAAGMFVGNGIIPGIVLGFLAYRASRKARISESVE